MVVLNAPRLKSHTSLGRQSSTELSNFQIWFKKYSLDYFQEKWIRVRVEVFHICRYYIYFVILKKTRLQVWLKWTIAKTTHIPKTMTRMNACLMPKSHSTTLGCLPTYRAVGADWSLQSVQYLHQPYKKIFVNLQSFMAPLKSVQASYEAVGCPDCSSCLEHLNRTD